MKLPVKMSRTNTSLLLKLEKLLYENIADPNFGISDFCEQLAISRTQLHRIISQEKDMSTSHYVRQLRLIRAKELLATTNLLVYEVADRVGFKNVAYFSTSFLAAFGYSPKDTKN